MNKFKKSLSQILSFVAVFALALSFAFGGVSFAENEGGSIGNAIDKAFSLFGAGNVVGEENYTTVDISTPEQLRSNLGDNSSGEETAGKIYVLQNDIDMSSVSNFRPVLEFRGVFRGNSKTISNLKINTTEQQLQSSDSIGFVRVLAANAKIENVTFNNYTLTDKLATAGMVAGRSYGIIDNVYVMGASGLNTNSNTLTAIGGLVGEYNKWRPGVNSGNNPTNPAYPTGSITNCTFAGYIKKNNAQLTGTNNNVGGLIGTINRATTQTYDSADITALYWDMSKTPGVNQPVGGSGTKPSGAVGFQMKTEKTMPNDSEAPFSEFITYNPTTAEPIAQWSIESQNPVSTEEGAQVLQMLAGDNTGVKAVGVGTAVVTYKIEVGSTSGGETGKSITATCTVRVVEDKEALTQLIADAEAVYPLSLSGDYPTEAYNSYTSVLQAAKDVRDNPNAVKAQINQAMENLNTEIDKLTEIDIQRLKDELNKYEPTTREASYYEPTGFAEFTNAYNTGRTRANSDTTTTLQVRNAIAGIKDTYDNLKLTLKNVEITRTDDNSEAIITIEGYNKPDAKIANNSTSQVTENTQIRSGSQTVDSAGKMTIRIAKATLGGNYNLGTKLTVVVNDTDKGESAPAEVTLPKRTNFITGDVNCGDLGTIAWGKQFEDVNIKNIPITYDLKTGDETNAKTDGKVGSWELDDDPQWTVDENDNYIGEQTWTTIGVKHLKGVIATTGDYQQPSAIADLKYAYATVEIIDKSELNNLVNAVSGYKEADFTKETWPAFNLARNAATNVNNSKDARQADITKALTDLQTAKEQLKAQPTIQLSAASANLRINDIFEPLTYVRQAKTFDKNIGEKGEYDTELILSTVRVTELNNDETIIIYENGELKTPLDTSKAGNHDLTFTVSNTDGISASAKLMVRVFGQGSNSPSSSDNGGDISGNVVPGKNSFTNGDVTIEFIGTDLFPEEEINKGIKFILEATKITDDTNIKGVLEKLKSVLKGEVTIDGMYEIKIYKEVNGEKIRIKDSDIKVPLDVYLPISDAAIASNDYACIHILSNGGYELIKGTVTELEGNKKLKIKMKSFSEVDVGYGGGISQVADAMNTDDTNNTNNNNNNGGSGTNGVNDNNGGNGANANGGQGGGDAAQNGDGSGGVAQGGGDGYIGLIKTGDNGIIFAVAITAGVSLIAVIFIMLQRRKQKNK